MLNRKLSNEGFSLTNRHFHPATPVASANSLAIYSSTPRNPWMGCISKCTAGQYPLRFYPHHPRGNVGNVRCQKPTIWEWFPYHLFMVIWGMVTKICVNRHEHPPVVGLPSPVRPVRNRCEAKNVWLTVVDTLHPHHSTFKAPGMIGIGVGNSILKRPYLSILRLVKLCFDSN